MSKVTDDLSKLSHLFKDVEWCQNCRDWYKSDLSECPECRAEMNKIDEVMR